MLRHNLATNPDKEISWCRTKIKFKLKNIIVGALRKLTMELARIVPGTDLSGRATKDRVR